MNKQEFLDSLGKGLSGLPKDDIEQRLSFYAEMIDDRVEEGLSEEEAVSELGSTEDIVSQILSEIPLSKLIKEKARPKRKLSGWEITLIVLGFPVWLPLLVAAFAIVLAFYVVVWSLIISLWAVDASFAGCAVGGLLAGVAMTAQGDMWQGIATVGAAMVCAGMFIQLLFGCQAATKGLLQLTKRAALYVKSLFMGKEK